MTISAFVHNMNCNIKTLQAIDKKKIEKKLKKEKKLREKRQAELLAQEDDFDYLFAAKLDQDLLDEKDTEVEN